MLQALGEVVERPVLRFSFSEKMMFPEMFDTYVVVFDACVSKLVKCRHYLFRQSIKRYMFIICVLAADCENL